MKAPVYQSNGSKILGNFILSILFNSAVSGISYVSYVSFPNVFCDPLFQTGERKGQTSLHFILFTICLNKSTCDISHVFIQNCLKGFCRPFFLNSVSYSSISFCSHCSRFGHFKTCTEPLQDKEEITTCPLQSWKNKTMAFSSSSNTL